MSFEELPFQPEIAMSGSSVQMVTRTAAERWRGVAVREAEREDRLPVDQAAVIWNKIYSLFEATGENSQDEAYAAVLNYFWVNGCSPLGAYRRSMVTGPGVRVRASDVVKCIGKLEGEIRQFLRGHMQKAYFCMTNATFLDDPVMREQAEVAGVPRHMSYLLADWFQKCEFFSLEERNLYEKTSVVSIREANKRRSVSEAKRAMVADSNSVAGDATPVVPGTVVDY